VAGIVLIVRSRVTRFELHRWLDGLVVVLIVATPMVALVLEPVLREAPSDPFGQIVALSYPFGDLVLIGALVGAVPLMSWRVDAGDFLWSAGSVAIAVAAWRRTTDFLPGFEPVGWPAVILPLGAQVFAFATQIYAYFDELPRTERLLTAVVLGIGIAQIIASRPRSPHEVATPPATPGHGL
jgi:hypothetical protein